MAERVRVSVPADEGQNRLWGIPILGIWIRAILVVPQLIILSFVAIAAAFVMLVSWIPILLNGRMAGWGYTVLGGYLRLTTRVGTYVLLTRVVLCAADRKYPLFRLGDLGRRAPRPSLAPRYLAKYPPRDCSVDFGSGRTIRIEESGSELALTG